MPTNILVISFLLFFLSSCSESSEYASEHSVNDSSRDLDISSLVEKQTGGGQDLATFLNSGNEVNAINVIDGAREEITHELPTRDFTISPISSGAKGVFSNKSSVPHEPENRSGNKEPSLGELNTSLKKLRLINARQDQTISSLTRLNEELLLEVQRLRLLTPAQPVNLKKNLITSESSGQLHKLQSEIAKLKSNLITKSKELDGLMVRNDHFESGIDSLQPRVLPLAINSDYRTYNEGNSLRRVESSARDNPQNFKDSSGTCSLEFDAVVTLLNGKNKEVFYTEFFLIKKSFPELLFDQGFMLEDYPQVDSFDELWAKARKSPFSYPGAYKRIRNILLEQVEKGLGYRIRTDIDGFAEFQNLTPASYYLVGTAPVGKIGAVWNIPIRLKSGSNKTSLTLTNANWRE